MTLTVRSWRSGAVLVLAVALAGCGRKPADEEAPKATAQVRTAVVAQATLARTTTAYGAVEFAPGAERTLAAPVEARVAQVLVGAGSPVVAGQTVILLSPSPQTEVDLKKAADDARTTRETYARTLRLKASGLDSNADVEAARAADVVAQATLQSLQARAAGLTVTSPVTGVVETLTAAPGDLVATGVSLAKLATTGAVRAQLGLEPSALAAVHPGDAVALTPTGGGPARNGTVLGLNPQVDAQTRLASVLVALPGAGSASGLAAGQAVKGEIVTGRSTGPVAPHAAIYYDQDQPYVLVVQAGVAHRRDVKLGVEQGEETGLVSGVRAGERIVVEGGASLDDGAAVTEAPAAPADAGKDAAKDAG